MFADDDGRLNVAAKSEVAAKSGGGPARWAIVSTYGVAMITSLLID
jgi:hypothetical protein